MCGNLGHEGENGLINEISELKNTKFLIIKNEEDEFWQSSKYVRNYITENLQYDGDIEEFSIYSK